MTEGKRSYKVVLGVLTQYEFVLDNCNSPEEAEAIAEDLLSEGESGNIVTRSIETVDYEELDEPLN